jgi:integrase
MYRKTFTYEGVRYDIRANTESEWAVKAAMKKRDIDEHRRIITKNMLVKDWAKQYLNVYKRESVSDQTYKGLLSYLNVWIIPVIGDMSLSKIKPIHCQDILNTMNGHSGSHVHKVSHLMNAMFESAKRNGLLIDNPAEYLTMPKVTDGTHRAITDYERQILLKACETHPHGLWALIILYCGLRPGETARIIGKHIDLDGRRLYVDGTKTKAAKRWVPIPDQLAPLLDSAAANPFEYLFTSNQGKPLSKTLRRVWWNGIVRAMNIEMGCKVFRNEVLPPYAVADDFVPYNLRHTFCTDLQAAGVPINVAKELMGHSSIEMTSRIYTHFSEQAFSNAAEQINAFHNSKFTLQNNLPHPLPHFIGEIKGN